MEKAISVIDKNIMLYTNILNDYKKNLKRFEGNKRDYNLAKYCKDNINSTELKIALMEDLKKEMLDQE